MPPPRISPQLLDKYLRNQCTDEERAQVEAWFASLDGPPDFLGSLPETEQRQLKDETFRSIREQLQTEEEPPVRTFWLGSGRLTGLAASVLLALGVFIAWRYTVNRHAATLADRPVPALTAPKAAPAEVVQFVNRKPRPVLHRLPDGSSVWMQRGAAIAYPKTFEPDRRRVSFSGEGFFDIQKDKTRPFFIRSGEMQIRVLGTSFNVNAPAARRVFRIAVVTGRVEVSAPDSRRQAQQVILKPQEQAVFETDSRRLTASAIPAQVRKEIYEPVSIVFSETPLDQAVAQLEKRFNVRFRLSNPKLGRCRVSADFERQSLPLILEMLCTALDATYTMTGNVIVLDGLPCEP
ncbi:FecR family protein [Larkinella soli]|uniref:FecR family protein n=1 Tax=Larkinella soli TaxID=1770527 RepID=UPI000FFBDE95|nr:FecR domain-containing protein [Larkinella soli]